MINDVNKRVGEQGFTLEVTEEAKEFLAKEGFDEMFGARPLRRAIQRHMEDSLSDALLKQEFKSGDHIVADIKDGKLILKNRENLA